MTFSSKITYKNPRNPTLLKYDCTAAFMWCRNRKEQYREQFHTYNDRMVRLDWSPCDSRRRSSIFQFQDCWKNLWSFESIKEINFTCRRKSNHQWPSFQFPMRLIRDNVVHVSMFQVVAKHHFWIQRWLHL